MTNLCTQTSEVLAKGVRIVDWVVAGFCVAVQRETQQALDFVGFRLTQPNLHLYASSAHPTHAFCLLPSSNNQQLTTLLPSDFC